MPAQMQIRKSKEMADKKKEERGDRKELSYRYDLTEFFGGNRGGNNKRTN